MRPRARFTLPLPYSPSRSRLDVSLPALALVVVALVHAPAPRAYAAHSETAGSITTITPVLVPDAATGVWMGFALVGTGFETLSAADLAALQPGDTPFLLLTDVTANWNAGCKGRQDTCDYDGVTVSISSWSDSKIVIAQLDNR